MNPINSSTSFRLWSTADTDSDGKVTKKEWAVAARSAITEQKSLLDQADKKKLNILSMIPGMANFAPMLESMGVDASTFKRDTKESKALTEKATAKSDDVAFLTRMSVGGKDNVGFGQTIGGDDGVDHIELTALLGKDGTDNFKLSEDDWNKYEAVYVADNKDINVDNSTDEGKATLTKLADAAGVSSSSSSDSSSNKLIKALMKMFGLPDELLDSLLGDSSSESSSSDDDEDPLTKLLPLMMMMMGGGSAGAASRPPAYPNANTGLNGLLGRSTSAQAGAGASMFGDIFKLLGV